MININGKLGFWKCLFGKLHPFYINHKIFPIWEVKDKL
jgi:hypothetical protein